MTFGWPDTYDIPAPVAKGVRDEAFRVVVPAERKLISFRQYIERVNPRYRFYPHVERLIVVLQAVADGVLGRVMVFMPPRHGKSELVSRLFPGYYLYRHPDRFTGLTSYAAELAFTFSRTARDNYLRIGGAIREDVSAVKQWETGQGGGLWAAGVGGPITGKGFHLGIIDDPLKNAEEAASETIRAKQKDWYHSTFYTREEPGGAIVVVQTRWNEDDLSGWLISEEAHSPEHWHIVNFEAIKSQDERRFPGSCTVEDDDRDVGAPLAPARYPLTKLEQIRSRIGAYYWSALYQQRPSPLEGGLWKREWFKDRTFDEPPEDLRYVGYDWDLAYTEDQQNSASAYVKSGLDRQGNVYILDADWRHLEFPALIAWMREKEGPHYVEAKASGKSAVQALRAQKITAIEVQVRGGDKIARTTLATPEAEGGRVFIAAHLLGKLLDDEKQGILKFPNAAGTDVNDVLVQAIHRLKIRGRSMGGAVASDRGEGQKAEQYDKSPFISWR